ARVDHTKEAEVKALVERVKEEQGALHILVNDVWGGDELVEFGKPFWEVSLDKGRTMLERAIFSHVITAHFAAPLMIETGNGLIVEITDGDAFYYRGNIFYDLVKTSVIRLAFAFARELRRRNVAAVAVTPGYLRSEAMLEYMGVTEQNWQEAAEKEPNFIMSESPLYVGRAVAALAADPNVSVKSGRVFSSWDLATEYDFTDADGRKPHWGKFYEEKYGEPIKKCDDGFYQYCFGGAVDTLFKDWP
ncbi:MAG TPA: SDR family oxidoreductase, partial [Blastocatellia bacterium]|nr:SDR family oxidoreductase [Blastocatellia bacterium]